MAVVLRSFLHGAKSAWTNRFLVGMMFLFKFVSSLVLLLPLYAMFSVSFARNVKASSFLAGLDVSLLIDFVYYWRRILPVYVLMFILACGTIVIAFVFLSGGFWGLSRDEIRGTNQDSRMERFFGYCGRYFWGMFRIWLLTGVFYFAALVAFLLFNVAFDSVAGRASLFHLTSWQALVRISVGLLLFFMVNMTGDYLRVSLMENYGERFFRVVRAAFRFVLTNLARTLSLYCCLSVISLAVFFLYLGLYEAVSTLPKIGFFIFCTFLIQQIFVLFSSFYRLVYYSSQLVLYEGISRMEDVAA